MKTNTKGFTLIELMIVVAIFGRARGPWRDALPLQLHRDQFTAQAFADLDDDGIFSTYERSGAGDIQGVNAAIGVYVDQEVE